MGHSHLLPPTEQATTEVPWAVCSFLPADTLWHQRLESLGMVVVVVCAGREPTTEAKSTTAF